MSSSAPVAGHHDLNPLLAAHRSYWQGWEGADVAGEPKVAADLVTYRTGIANPMMNGVLRVQDTPTHETIRLAREQFAGLPWVWWVGADSSPQTADALTGAGAQPQLRMPIMAAPIEDVTHDRTPQGLTGEPVRDESDLREYVSSYLKSFGRPAQSLDQCVTQELGHAGGGNLIRLIGRTAGRTVATCAVLIHAEVAAAYYVTTDSAYRRRGIATALTAQGLQMARDRGARTATLQARGDAVSVYRRMGFQAVSQFQLYSF